MLTVRPGGDYFVVGLCVEDILDRFGVYFGQCNLYFFDFVSIVEPQTRVRVQGWQG